MTAAKAVDGLIHICNAGAGTSLPGKVARAIDSGLLANLATQIRKNRIAVTGTNGKTTTCGLLAQFLQEANQQVIHNQLGANMVPGITAALLKQSSLGGQLNADIGVFEVDEASLKGLAAEVSIDRVLVGNLFRDQLDRYGELDTTARLIKEGIDKTQISASGGSLFLNADDPLVAALGRQYSNMATRYYGIVAVDEGTIQHIKSPVPYTRELTTCPACHQKLHYTRITMGHLGHYACTVCDYRRPTPEITAEQVRVTPEGSHLHLRAYETEFELFLPLPGLFNVYNLLGAMAVLADLGFMDTLPQLVTQGVSHYQSVFGRAERKTVNGKNLLVLLIKNPVGASEVLKLVGNDPKGTLLVALNDNYADGRDVSWIWDAQFDYLLANYKDKPITVSGSRAEDMALRLRYAGLPQANLHVKPDLATALHHASSHTPDDHTLYVLPTYTALLSLRGVFK